MRREGSFGRRCPSHWKNATQRIASVDAATDRGKLSRLSLMNVDIQSTEMSELRAPAQLREHAGEACALLKALANEDRLMLLCQMASARQSVGELESATGIRQPTLSQQLAVLRQSGLVSTEREGKYIYYRLANDNVVHVMRTLSDIYCAPKP